MTTHALIGIPVDRVGTMGRWHQHDSYPTGLGAALIRAYQDTFKSLGDMIEALIFDHPGGWQTIVNARWSLTPGQREGNENRKCVECGRYHWQHYSQYYEAHGAIPLDDTQVMQLGHWPINEQLLSDARPTCYCHDIDGKLKADTYNEVYRCTAAVGHGCDGATCGNFTWVYKLSSHGLFVYSNLGVVMTTAGPIADGRHVKAGRVSWEDPLFMQALDKIEADYEKALVERVTQREEE